LKKKINLKSRILRLDILSVTKPIKTRPKKVKDSVFVHQLFISEEMNFYTFKATAASWLLRILLLSVGN